MFTSTGLRHQSAPAIAAETAEERLAQSFTAPRFGALGAILTLSFLADDFRQFSRFDI